MSRAPVAWVFNLDAEDELKRQGPHTPTRDTRERTERLRPVLEALLGPGDEVLWPATGPKGGARVGRAWCPTPWALAEMARGGVEAPPAPSRDVLRAVNHRRFCAGLGGALPGAQFVEDEAALRAALSDRATLGRVSVERNWLLKLPLGYAGRGRRKISGPDFNAADRTWIDAALRGGDGLQVEPLVERALDVGLHGFLEPDGAVVLGAPTVATIDASGTWLSTRRAETGELTPAERDALEGAARQTATALHQAGYFGPFGLDAFRWRDSAGMIHFHPRCEVNARYSMGWGVGLPGFGS